MSTKEDVIFDIECFPNYFLIMFLHSKSDAIKAFDTKNVLSTNQIKEIYRILHSYHIIGFNSLRYDMPMIMAALKKHNIQVLYQISNMIINDSFGKVYTYDELQTFLKSIYHQDIIYLQNQIISLKTLGARLHHNNIVELPLPSDTNLSDTQIITIKEYCRNDCFITQTVWNELKKEAYVRETLDKMYPYIKQLGTAKNMKDATLCENIICQASGIPKQKGINVNFMNIFHYKAPSNLNFKNEYLKKHLHAITNGTFEVDSKYQIIAPTYFKNDFIRYGGAEWNIGIGGIHTRDKNIWIDKRRAPYKKKVIINFDVSAFYPSMLLNLKLGPYGEDKKNRFLRTLKSLVEQRKNAKKTGNKSIADALKVPLNSITGKLNSKYSIAYNPADYIRMTVSGQLYMLKLAEMLFTSCKSAKIWSANTDGIVAVCDSKDKFIMVNAGQYWAKEYNFELDVEEFTAIYARDVNNYFALFEKPDIDSSAYKIKKKGFFAELSTRKVRGESNPMATICNDAVIAYIAYGKPIDVTIKENQDITKFVFVTNVRNPGAKWRERKLGKTVRFIWTTDGDSIKRVSNDYLVPRSEKSMPVLELPTYVPIKLDYDRYIKYANDILEGIGGRF